ncbi:MAG: flagellar motor switch protein FliN [Candidatus Lustribacter sp.]|jgi:flagellar motor switch protein FliN/FliY
MFAAATGAFSTLAGIGATAGTPEMENVDGSIKVEPDVVATLTRLPAASVSFVTRFVKADIGNVVAMMLGTPGGDAEMDAMQLSIVAETVAQIATAMGEALAGELGVAADGVNSEVVNDAAGFPVPPFTSFTAPISVGEALATSLTIDFDGLSLSKMDIKPAAASAAAPEPLTGAAAAAAAMAAAMADPKASPPAPGRARPAPEGQAAQFAPMQPTGIRPAAPGQSNLDLVHDVPLEISAVLGQTELSLREVVAMVPGSVFELDKLSTEPIDLYVNNILIARGEVVVVDDKFAVKISELNPVVDRI